MPDLRDLVALATGNPEAIASATAGTTTAVSNNSKRRAYDAGVAAAQQSGMDEVELILFIEGFRAGLLKKVIGD